MSFEEDLAAQVAADFETIDVPVVVGEHPYIIRITQMGGLQWADTIDRHPARLGVELDKSFGYNLRSLALSVIQSHGQLIRDGENIDVTKEQWDQLLRSLDGGAIAGLGEAVFTLNEAARYGAILQAGKALAAAPGNSSN